MAHLAVVYQSQHGHTKILAEAIRQGAGDIAGVTHESLRVSPEHIEAGRFRNEELMQALDAADGIVFGCATYMGSCSAVFKTFLEAAFIPRWFEQRWKDKVAAGFTNSASQNGDKASSLYQLFTFAMQMGMIWVGVGDLPGNNWSGGARSDVNRLGTWVGAMGQSNADEDSPSVGDIDTAIRFGARIALITRKFRDGTPYETERWTEKTFRAHNAARRAQLE
jgi:NAD(P)H dehydrogenase (quinone)